MTATRVLFYVQHLLGIGHLARASRIASALAARGMAVTLVTGGLPVKGFPGPDVTHVALPPLAVGDGSFAGLVDGSGQPATQAYLDTRRDQLLGLFHDLSPGIVLTEAFPFGRRQVRFELLPLLDAIARQRPKPFLAVSLRDILQRKEKPGRAEETVATVLAHYDAVLVHGDPAFARLDDSFPLAPQLAHKLHYTGLVCPPAPAPSDKAFDIVVSAGGGAVGAALTMAALAAARARPDLARWCVITGPNLPQATFDALAADAPPSVELHRFCPDLASLLAACRLSVSQAGYNTVADILQAGCRALLVPFAAGGETEQTDRARLLQAAGRVEVLAEDALSGTALSAAIDRALTMTVRATPVATDGAARSAILLQDLMSGSQ